MIANMFVGLLAGAGGARGCQGVLGASGGLNNARDYNGQWRCDEESIGLHMIDV